MTRNSTARALTDAGENTAADHRHPGSENLLPAWQKGQSGNPAGRPRGARSKLTELALVKLLQDFETHGEDVIRQVREKLPQNYLAAVVSLMPKQQEKIESPFSDLTDDELEQLEHWLAASRAKQVEALPDDTTDPLKGRDA